MSKKDTLKFFRKLDERLREHFGKPDFEPEADPTGSLIRGILSANTNDTNRDRAFDRLVESFPDQKTRWQDVYKTDTEKLAEIIRPAGMSMIRAQRIKGVLEWLDDKFGEMSAEKVLEMSPNEAFEQLQKIKGIGAKTAAVFLVFNSAPDSVKFFPVDTHIHRVAGRIGIFPTKASPSQMQKKFTEIVEPDIVMSFHVNLIELGRNICNARSASCHRCPILDICEQNLPKEKIEKPDKED